MDFDKFLRDVVSEIKENEISAKRQASGATQVEGRIAYQRLANILRNCITEINNNF